MVTKLEMKFYVDDKVVTEGEHKIYPGGPGCAPVFQYQISTGLVNIIQGIRIDCPSPFRTTIQDEEGSLFVLYENNEHKVFDSGVNGIDSFRVSTKVTNVWGIE